MSTPRQSEDTMSGQDSVQGRPPIEAERKAAEHEYITTSFNYPEAPVGSRDWTIYWAGWLARSTHALASSVAKPETQEPFWHAVVSERAPVINKAIRRADVAEEYADQCREMGHADIEVVPLYRAAASTGAAEGAKPAVQQSAPQAEVAAKDRSSNGN